MANFTETLKSILSKSAATVGKAAKNVASATRFKMSELDGVSRRREAINELGEKVYSLFETGVELPEELQPLLNEVRAMNESLDVLRSDRAATKAAAAEAAAEAKAARAQARAEAKAAAQAAKEAASEMEIAAEEEAPLTYTAEAPVMEVEAEEEEEEETPTVM